MMKTEAQVDVLTNEDDDDDIRIILGMSCAACRNRLFVLHWLCRIMLSLMHQYCSACVGISWKVDQQFAITSYHSPCRPISHTSRSILFSCLIYSSIRMRKSPQIVISCRVSHHLSSLHPHSSFSLLNTYMNVVWLNQREWERVILLCLAIIQTHHQKQLNVHSDSRSETQSRVIKGWVLSFLLKSPSQQFIETWMCISISHHRVRSEEEFWDLKETRKQPASERTWRNILNI